jgi:hypothetical protein
MKHKGLNQLVSAATVNGRFCSTLLRDPAQALAAGYFGHSFSLTPEERDLVIGIQAHRLEDFAAQIYSWMRLGGKGHDGNGHNGNGYNGNGYNGNGHNGNNGNGHTTQGQQRQMSGLLELDRIW